MSGRFEDQEPGRQSRADTHQPEDAIVMAASSGSDMPEARAMVRIREGFVSGAADVPHSGQRVGVARKSYPQEGQSPLRARFDLRSRRENRYAGATEKHAARNQNGAATRVREFTALSRCV